eukprot:3044196-Amphidinium_carterae.1
MAYSGYAEQCESSACMLESSGQLKITMMFPMVPICNLHLILVKCLWSDPLNLASVSICCAHYTSMPSVTAT